MDIRFFAHRNTAVASPTGIACKPNVRESENQKQARANLESIINKMETYLKKPNGVSYSDTDSIIRHIQKFKDEVIRLVGKFTGPFEEVINTIRRNNFIEDQVFGLKEIIPKVVALVK